MKEFMFDLQRFDTITIQSGRTSVVTLDGTARSIAAGSQDIVVDFDETNATINLSSNVNFRLDGTRYQCESGSIEVTIGASNSTVGSINTGDEFIIGNETYYLNSGGTSLFATETKGNTPERLLSLSSTSSFVYDGVTWDNWIKLVPVSDNNLVLGTDDFNKGTYSSVVAMDDATVPATIYATMSILDDGSNSRYQISASSDGSLNSISLASAVVNSGITFDNAFGGTSAPVIIVDSNSLQAVNVDRNFIMNYNRGTASLDGNAREISLIGGSLNTAIMAQTLIAGGYSISDYTGGSNGIILYRSGDNVTIGDIDTGESFKLNGNTYRKTALGLANSDGQLLFSDGGDGNILDSLAMSVSDIINAAPNSAKTFNSSEVFNIASDTASPITIVSDSGDYAVYSYDDTAHSLTASSSNIDFSGWGGVSLSGVDFYFSTDFAKANSPLKIMTQTGNATFAVTTVTSGQTTFSVSGSGEADDYLSLYTNVSSVSLQGGNFLGRAGQTIFVSNANLNVRSTGSGAYASINANASGDTNIYLREGNGRRYTVGSGVFGVDSSLASAASLTSNSQGTTVSLSTATSLPTSFTFNGNDTVTYAVTRGDAVFTYSNSDVTVSGLNDGTSNETFTATNSTSTVTYAFVKNSSNAVNRNGGVLQAVSGGVYKIYAGNQNDSYSMSELDFTNGSLSTVILANATADSVRVATSLLSALADNASISIYSTDYSKLYGTFSKTTSGYRLVRPANANAELTALTFTGTNELNLEVASDFKDLPITATINRATTVFTPSSASGNFTISSASSVISLTGANAVNVTSGSIVTDQANQTITAGGAYVISGYSGGSDGINVQVAGSSTATYYYIGDIDDGESFIFNGTTYTKSDVGLTYDNDGAQDVFTSVSGGVVNLASLLTRKRGSIIITDDKTLTIGGENSFNANVVNTDRSKTYAALDVASSGFTLNTVASGASWGDDITTISLHLTMFMFLLSRLRNMVLRQVMS